MNIENIIEKYKERDEELKKYNSKDINEKYEMDYNEYILGCFLNRITDENKYETYIYIIKNNKVVPGILYEISEDFNYIYNKFSKLKEIVAKNDLNSL